MLKISREKSMKTALITGGSRGIGRAMVELFSKEGYRVAFTYKNSEAEAMALAIATGSLAILADSASESDIIYAVETAKRELGHIDCLVNNAGVAAFSLFTETTLAEWQRVFSINLDSAFLYSREVCRNMISAHKGRIINVGSMWGISGSSCEVAYSASKAALHGMTKALAKELGPSGITVNAIAPGLIDTDMNSSLERETIDEIVSETPVMRIGTPEDVAELALFLASDKAGFITGEVISVNGGFLV